MNLWLLLPAAVVYFLTRSKSQAVDIVADMPVKVAAPRVLTPADSVVAAMPVPVSHPKLPVVSAPVGLFVPAQAPVLAQAEKSPAGNDFIDEVGTRTRIASSFPVVVEKNNRVFVRENPRGQRGGSPLQVMEY